MNIVNLILPYLGALVLMLAVDLLWLGLIAKNFYKQALSKFLSPKPNWAAAVVFYFLFIVGVFIFAVVPAVEKNNVLDAIRLGGLFGFFAYATYDLTNLALMKDWPIKIVIVDILWGTFLTALVSAAGFLLTMWL